YDSEKIFDPRFAVLLSHCVTRHSHSDLRQGFLFEDIFEDFENGALCSLCLRLERNAEALSVLPSSEEYSLLSNNSKGKLPQLLHFVALQRFVTSSLVQTLTRVDNLLPGTELEVHTTTSSEAVALRPMIKNVRVLTLPHLEFEYCNVYRGTFGKTLPVIHRHPDAVVILWNPSDHDHVFFVTIAQLLPCLQDMKADNWSMIVFWNEVKGQVPQQPPNDDDGDYPGGTFVPVPEDDSEGLVCLTIRETTTEAIHQEAGEGNDPSTLLNDFQHAEHREFAPTYSDVGFRIPEDSDPRSKKPKQDDPDYAAKLMLHNAFCSERDVWAEIKAVRADFSTVVSAVSQAYGQDFFSYVQKHWENLEVRRKYKINTPEGYTLYDSSLKEPWNASLVLAALDKQFRTMGTPSFTSAFAKKAHADLISYENLRAQCAREIDEVDEPMEQAGGSAEAAPADSPSGEMAGEAKQEPDSGAPMETDAPEGSPSGEVSGVKVEEPERSSFPPSAAPDDVRVEEASESGDHATGGSPSQE
ncbi:unnamed protein product, partial [Symbiodinium necroappetens]